MADKEGGDRERFSLGTTSGFRLRTWVGREAERRTRRKKKIETSACVCHYDFKSTALLDAGLHIDTDVIEKAEP